MKPNQYALKWVERSELRGFTRPTPPRLKEQDILQHIKQDMGHFFDFNSRTTRSDFDLFRMVCRVTRFLWFRALLINRVMNLPPWMTPDLTLRWVVNTTFMVPGLEYYRWRRRRRMRAHFVVFICSGSGFNQRWHYITVATSEICSCCLTFRNQQDSKKLA